MHIENDKLIGTNVRHHKGKIQHGGRILPTVIVLHFDASPPVPGHSVRFIKSGGGRAKASYHAVTQRDGTVDFLVDFDRKAHHAGRSSYKGRRHANGWSIGLAAANSGKWRKVGRQGVFWSGARIPLDKLKYATDRHGKAGWWEPYTAAQLAAMKEQCRLLIERYPSIKDIVDHSIVSPGRKVDVGPLFPLDQWRVELFAGNKVTDGMLRPGDSGRAVNRAILHLFALGYWSGSVDDDNFGPAMESAVLSFQKQNGITVDGIIGPKTWAALENENAKPFPSGAREAGGAEAFKATKSETKDTAEAVELTTGLSVAGGLASITDMSKIATAWQEPLEAIKGFADFMATGLIPFVFTQWKIVAFFVVMITGFFMARRVKSLRFRDWLSYKHVGK